MTSNQTAEKTHLLLAIQQKILECIPTRAKDYVIVELADSKTSLVLNSIETIVDGVSDFSRSSVSRHRPVNGQIQWSIATIGFDVLDISLYITGCCVFPSLYVPIADPTSIDAIVNRAIKAIVQRLANDGIG